jgi:hypothetical protein
MTNKTDSEALQFIAPLEVQLSIDGVDLTIRPLVLRELPNLLALAMPVFASLGNTGPGYLERLKDGALTDAETSTLLTAIVVNGDEFIGLITLCSRQPKEWVGGLLPDRAAELAAVCLQVNADFFRRAMPNLRAMASRVNVSATPQSGSTTATPSRSS